MSRVNGHGPPLPGLPPVHEARIPVSSHSRRGGKGKALLHEKRLARRRLRRRLRKRCSVLHAMNVNLGERRMLKLIRRWPRKLQDEAFVRLMSREAAKRWRREMYYGDKDAWK